jgi:hypothetical protein
MLITLAAALLELPAQVSWVLAMFLTVILLPWAIVKARQRQLALAGMTLAMLGCLWRGETWKYGCLEAEQLLSQLPQQCLQLLPKTAFSGRESDFPGGEIQFVPRVGARRFPPVDARCLYEQIRDLSQSSLRGTLPRKILDNLLTAYGRDQQTSPGRTLSLFAETFGNPQGDPITTELEKRYPISNVAAAQSYNLYNDRHPNTFTLYMTYIV